MPPKGQGELESRAEMSARHLEEWKELREKIIAPYLATEDVEKAKLAKAIADVYKLAQEGERKALGFDQADDASAADGGIQIAWQE